MAGSAIRLDAWTKVQGSPTPLGATWVDSAQAWNFALYSTEATAVRLLIYGKDDFVNPIRSYDLDSSINKTIRVWHILVPASAVPGALYYAFKVGGPHNPSGGQFFDSGKVLLDPYARGIFLPPNFSRAAATSPAPNDGMAPLGILPAQGLPAISPDNRPAAAYTRPDYLRTARAQLHQRSQLGPRRRHARHLRRRDCQNSLSARSWVLPPSS